MLKVKQGIFTISVTCLLLLAVVSGSIACSSSHQTYLYHGPSVFNADQYAGGNLSIPWKAHPGPVVTDGSAVPLVLLVRLIGPFNHIDDLLGAIRKHKDDPDPSSMGSIVASSSPIGTDTWTNKTFTSVIHFPSDVRPGY